ncbi:hypothetical protein EPA93_38975 [Ktedonosporobacter rubrisoli]|uniref:DNA mismatch repair proteins mutS family domain-containing protein n=1 Tax=Ktedonosporobacter rubrisoli TaxID=2509675 RepID=A0A4P6K0H5_KTERU|nr:MutS family DNA mismatch repair protein [Ktedonosporobacter rubrisoli]QBD81637.1 hypothetical protein EPA93_38975 [Ktedonosporobacter rubrisoli]
MNKKQERLYLLERQIERLKRRVDRLDQRSNRYSWLRVGIFFGGLLLCVLAFLVSWWLVAVMALIALSAFFIVAHFQGKIDRSLNRHRIWLYIKSTHVARIKLDWNNLPPVPAGEARPEHPFETDLDITGERSIYRLLNVAASLDGGQRLRNWLLATAPDLEAIRRRQVLVHEMLPLTLFRDKLILKSLIASKRSAEHLEGQRLLNWLQQQARPAKLLPLFWGSLALNVLTLVLLVLVFVLNLQQYWIISLLCSIVLFYTTKSKRGDTLEDADFLGAALGTLGGVFEYLEAFPYRQAQNVGKLCEPFLTQQAKRPSALLTRTSRIATVSMLGKNALLHLLFNAFLPWDVYWAYRLGQCKEQIAERLPLWLDIWFELEALNSLATFAYLNPEYVLPEVEAACANSTEQKTVFQGRDLGHPLIPVDKKVTNSFTLNELGDVVIITGSNMSGKSTFLRTLGVNLCLAYAGSVVNASQLQTELFRIFTCIKVSDSVTDGYSYFYAEVRRLKALLQALEQKEALPLFFLIDEIFKGTNNRERLIGSRSYVHALAGRNCAGLLSTHDLELVKLAEILPQVTNRHFREEVVDGQMLFDYKLRSGPCPTTNALKIMRMEGLPVEDGL